MSQNQQQSAHQNELQMMLAQLAQREQLTQEQHAQLLSQAQNGMNERKMDQNQALTEAQIQQQIQAQINLEGRQNQTMNDIRQQAIMQEQQISGQDQYLQELLANVPPEQFQALTEEQQMEIITQLGGAQQFSQLQEQQAIQQENEQQLQLMQLLQLNPHMDQQQIEEALMLHQNQQQAAYQEQEQQKQQLLSQMLEPEARALLEQNPELQAILQQQQNSEQQLQLLNLIQQESQPQMSQENANLSQMIYQLGQQNGVNPEQYERIQQLEQQNTEQYRMTQQEYNQALQRKQEEDQNKQEDSQNRNGYDKNQDKEFKDQLWKFYKTMFERLGPNALDKVTKISKKFSDQIDQTIRDFREQRKGKGGDNLDPKGKNSKMQRASGICTPPPPDKNYTSLGQRQNSQPSDNMDFMNDEDDENESFVSLLYGNESKLDPDTVIQEVMDLLKDHKDLAENLMRFLPDDDFEKGSIASNFLKLREANTQQFTIDDEHLEHLIMEGRHKDPQVDIEVRVQLMQKLKSYQWNQLLQVLYQYGTTKSQKGINEALSQWQVRIMEVAENYQKCTVEEMKLRVEFNQENTDNEKLLNDICQHMELLTSIIPREVTDSFDHHIDITQANEDEDDQSKVKSKLRGKSNRNNEYSHIESDGLDFQSHHSFQQDDHEDHQLDQPQTKSMKSLERELNIKDPVGAKNINKLEIKAFENFYKALRSEQDWILFCKFFSLYFDGVINIKLFALEFDDRFSYVRQEVRDELTDFLFSRENSRRTHSDILRPWNDLEHQTFQKLAGSSYLKMNKDFPLPICTQKINPEHNGFYPKLLNDYYLSLATGSENYKFKVRNVNEDMIFKNEDDMYKIFQQIDLFEACLVIIQKEIDKFTAFEKEGNKKEILAYRFPAKKLRPMICYMEEKYRFILEKLVENTKFDLPTFQTMKQGFEGKLIVLQNYKIDHNEQFKDIYRKNFAKSLDHRSFQYKDFIKKFLTKQVLISSLKSIALNNLCGHFRHQSMLKGGNFKESPFFHTIGPFVKYNTESFSHTNEVKDFPIDMNYPDFDQLVTENLEKMPHLRILFHNDQALRVTIKLLCLYIHQSPAHHVNDRPRLIECMRQVLEVFMGMSEFRSLEQKCNFNKIKGLTPHQVDLIMNQNAQQYYFLRSEQKRKNIQCEQLTLDLEQANEEDSPSASRPNGVGEEFINSALNKILPIAVQLQEESSKSLFESVQKKVDEQDDSDKLLSTPPRKKQDFDVMSEKSVASSHRGVKSAKKNCKFLLEQSPAQPIAKEEQTNEEIHFKEMNITEEDSLNDASKSLFLPHMNQQARDKGVNLMYSPINVLMFLKYFYAVYERIMKSQELVQKKVKVDIEQMSHEEKVKYGLVNEKTGQIDQELIDLFNKERYEYLLKGIFATTTSQTCSGVVPSNQISYSQSMYTHNHFLLDQNKYEDYSRTLLGSNAFLLFQIEKIISQVIKQLHAMHNDHTWHRALMLFQRQFNQRNPTFNERRFLAEYAEYVIEQFSFNKEMMEVTQSPQHTPDDCGHTVKKFVDINQGMSNENQPKNEKSDLSTTAIQQQLQNFQAFRLMWSKSSKIMSIHMINLNPYQIQFSGSKKRILTDNFATIYKHTYEPILREDNVAKCDCSSHRLIDQVTPPIFLKRNIKQMRKIRDKESIASLLKDKKSVHSSMTFTIIPQTVQLTYESKGEDVFIGSSLLKKRKLAEKDLALMDLELKTRAEGLRTKRYKSIVGEE